MSEGTHESDALESPRPRDRNMNKYPQILRHYALTATALCYTDHKNVDSFLAQALSQTLLQAGLKLAKSAPDNFS